MNRIVLIVAFTLLSALHYGQEKRLALVIGNGIYHPGILLNPENDARAMEGILKEIGFQVLKYENLNQKDMAKAIDDFGNRLKKFDVGLFYYAGHGVQVRGFNYLLPVDADLKKEADVEYNCVRADRVLANMEEAKSKINIVILDACRDNPFEKSWTRSTRSRGLATMETPVGSIIGFATAPGATASDGFDENSPYTSALLTYLNEPGITIDQMFNKVTARVLKKSNNSQAPWTAKMLTGDFYLVPGSGKADNSLVLSNAGNLTEAPADERAVVVLPFENLTGKDDMDYIVQGQTRALNAELSAISQVKPLRVLGRQTAARFVNPSKSIPELADEVNADYIIDGSVLPGAGDSINIQVSLIQAFPEERLVWAQIYKSDLANVLKLHNNIAGQIVRKMGFDLTPRNLATLPAPGKINPETYKSYLRGMYNIKLSTPESIKKGIVYLNEAISLDPADAFAYSGLAIGYFLIAHGPEDPGDAMIKAEAAALQAIRLDTTMAETYYSLAMTYQYSLWKFAEAEKYYKKALSIDPNSADAHFHYAWALLLQGRNDEALAEQLLAKKYDPFDPDITAQLGWLYLHIGEKEKALQEALKSLEIRPDYNLGLWGLGDAYFAMGKIDEAIATHKKLAEKYPRLIFKLGITYARAGRKSEAEEALKSMNTFTPVSPMLALGYVMLNSALNNKDEAFKWLAYEPRHIWLPWVAVLDWGDNLRDDPRFDEFLKKLNISKKN